MFNFCVVGYFGIGCAKIIDGKLMHIIIAGQPGKIFHFEAPFY